MLTFIQFLEQATSAPQQQQGQANWMQDASKMGFPMGPLQQRTQQRQQQRQQWKQGVSPQFQQEFQNLQQELGRLRQTLTREFLDRIHKFSVIVPPLRQMELALFGFNKIYDAW